MLLCMYSRPSRGSGPLRTGFVCGIVGVLVALVSDLYFLFVDPADTSGWVLAVIAQYRTRLALAAFLLLAILAALRVRPTTLFRSALPITAPSRRRPGGDGGRRYGRVHAVPEDSLTGHIARRTSPRLRRGGRTEDRLLRQRGKHGDPADPAGARGFSREGQGHPATGTGLRGRGDPATAQPA